MGERGGEGTGVGKGRVSAREGGRGGERCGAPVEGGGGTSEEKQRSEYGASWYGCPCLAMQLPGICTRARRTFVHAEPAQCFAVRSWCITLTHVYVGRVGHCTWWLGVLGAVVDSKWPPLRGNVSPHNGTKLYRQDCAVLCMDMRRFSLCRGRAQLMAVSSHVAHCRWSPPMCVPITSPWRVAFGPKRSVPNGVQVCATDGRGGCVGRPTQVHASLGSLGCCRVAGLDGPNRPPAPLKHCAVQYPAGVRGACLCRPAERTLDVAV